MLLVAVGTWIFLGLALALDPTAQLENAQSPGGSDDEGPRYSGEEQGSRKGRLSVPAEERDLDLLCVLQDEDGQEQKQERQDEDGHPESAGPGAT